MMLLHAAFSEQQHARRRTACTAPPPHVHLLYAAAYRTGTTFARAATDRVAAARPGRRSMGAA